MADMIDGQIIEGPVGGLDIGSSKAWVLHQEAQWKWGPEVSAYILNVCCIRSKYDFVAEFKSSANGLEALEKANLRITQARKDGDTDLDVGADVPRSYFSRVRQAVESMQKAQKRAASLEETGTEEHMNAIEATEVIKRWLTRFFNRYRFTPPLSKMPGDQLLSRLSRELKYRKVQILSLIHI